LDGTQDVRELQADGAHVQVSHGRHDVVVSHRFTPLSSSGADDPPRPNKKPPRGHVPLGGIVAESRRASRLCDRRLNFIQTRAGRHPPFWKTCTPSQTAMAAVTPAWTMA